MGLYDKGMKEKYMRFEYIKSWISFLVLSWFFQMDSQGKYQNIEAKVRNLFWPWFNKKLRLEVSEKLNKICNVFLKQKLWYQACLSKVYQENEANWPRTTRHEG